MPDMSLSMSLDDRQDDLPRTLRRKSLRTADDEDTDAAAGQFVDGHVVTDIRIPFGRLVLFCFKAAFAAIPALVFLAAVLYVIGAAVGILFPSLSLIRFGVQIGR